MLINDPHDKGSLTCPSGIICHLFTLIIFYLPAQYLIDCALPVYYSTLFTHYSGAPCLNARCIPCNPETVVRPHAMNTILPSELFNEPFNKATNEYLFSVCWMSKYRQWHQMALSCRLLPTVKLTIITLRAALYAFLNELSPHVCLVFLGFLRLFSFQ